MLAGSASRVLARLLLGSEGLLQLLILWRRFEHLYLYRLAILPLRRFEHLSMAAVLFTYKDWPFYVGLSFPRKIGHFTSPRPRNLSPSGPHHMNSEPMAAFVESSASSPYRAPGIGVGG